MLYNLFLHSQMLAPQQQVAGAAENEGILGTEAIAAVRRWWKMTLTTMLMNVREADVVDPDPTPKALVPIPLIPL